MNRTARAALDAHISATTRVLKAIVKEPVLVTSRTSSTIPNALTADVRVAQGQPVEVRANRQLGRLWIAWRQTLLVLPDSEDPKIVDAAIDYYSYQLFRGDGQTRFDEVFDLSLDAIEA